MAHGPYRAGDDAALEAVHGKAVFPTVSGAGCGVLEGGPAAAARAALPIEAVPRGLR
ncbi:hypothetical protein SNL152K_2112 [Streptomyces sp. NL15-2K]|nr:hypothetical protein SNL152K_2112 [Streptomyces sp. NL15-2K]